MQDELGAYLFTRIDIEASSNRKQFVIKTRQQNKISRINVSHLPARSTKTWSITDSLFHMSTAKYDPRSLHLIHRSSRIGSHIPRDIDRNTSHFLFLTTQLLFQCLQLTVGLKYSRSLLYTVIVCRGRFVFTDEGVGGSRIPYGIILHARTHTDVLTLPHK